MPFMRRSDHRPATTRARHRARHHSRRRTCHCIHRGTRRHGHLRPPQEFTIVHFCRSTHLRTNQHRQHKGPVQGYKNPCSKVCEVSHLLVVAVSYRDGTTVVQVRITLRTRDAAVFWDFGSLLLATENLQIEQATQIKLRSNPDRPPENTTRASANSSQFSHGRG